MQADMLAPDSGRALWLTREKDVVAHLFFAAAEIGTVEIDVAGSSVAGTMSFPSVDQRQFSIFASDTHDAPPLAPEPGTVVRVRYYRGDAAYSFLTAVREITEDQRWRLDFPGTIERNERRIVGRHRVLATGGFRVRVHTPDGMSMVLPVFDLSTAGVGFVFDPDHLDLARGASLSATVVLPGGATIPVLLEIGNLRDLPGGQSEKVAGCRFAGISATDLAAVAGAIADSRRRPR